MDCYNRSDTQTALSRGAGIDIVAHSAAGQRSFEDVATAESQS